MLAARLSHTFCSGKTPDLKFFFRTMWPGSQTTVVFLSWQIGGGRNMDHHVLHVAVGLIKDSRELRLQPFNEYRKRFGLKPYTSFQELTGEQLFPGLSSCPQGTLCESERDIEETIWQAGGWRMRSEGAWCQGW